MEIVSVVLQAVGIAMVVYGLVLASRNGLGQALISRRASTAAARARRNGLGHAPINRSHTKVNLAA